MLNPLKLIQDVPTRWNVTYFMVERLVLLKDAVKSSIALSERDDSSLSSGIFAPSYLQNCNLFMM